MLSQRPIINEKYCFFSKIKLLSLFYLHAIGDEKVAKTRICDQQDGGVRYPTAVIATRVKNSFHDRVFIALSKFFNNFSTLITTVMLYSFLNIMKPPTSSQRNFLMRNLTLYDYALYCPNHSYFSCVF